MDNQNNAHTPTTRPAWRALYEEFAARGYKVSVFRKDAHCLEMSDAWEGSRAGIKAELLGKGYLEFMHPDYVEAFISWCASDRTGPFSYPAIMGSPENRTPMIVSLSKITVEGVNVMVGATAKITSRAVLAQIKYSRHHHIFWAGAFLFCVVFNLDQYFFGFDIGPDTA